MAAVIEEEEGGGNREAAATTVNRRTSTLRARVALQRSLSSLAGNMDEVSVHEQHSAVLEQCAKEKGERKQDANGPQGPLAVPGQFALREKRKAGRKQACKCRQFSDCTQRAAVKKDKAKNRQVKRRAANQAAGDKAGQRKNTEARQRKRAANQEAGDKAEQGKSTVARQRKRAGIREGAKTGIQPWASARHTEMVGI